MSDEIFRDLGDHGARLKILEGKVDLMSDKVDQVLDVVNQHKGGWRVLGGVATLAGAMGAAVTNFVLKIKGG